MSEVETGRPTSRDVARRLLVLKGVVAHALCTPPREEIGRMVAGWSAAEKERLAVEGAAQAAEYWDQFREAGLWDALSPRERDFAGTHILSMTEQQQVDGSWRVESVQVLMWALGLLDGLPPYDQMASHDLLKQFPSGTSAELIEGARLRPSAVIDRERDLAELWHWRSRTRQLAEESARMRRVPGAEGFGPKDLDGIVRTVARRAHQEDGLPVVDDDFAVCGKAYRDLTPEEWSDVRSVTMERHFALNWLCGYAEGNAWDVTPTDT